MDTLSLEEFLKPYIKSMVSAGGYTAYIIQSTIYLLIDNAVIMKMYLPSVIDPNLVVSFNSNGIISDNSFVYQKYIWFLSHIDNMVYEDPVVTEDETFKQYTQLKAADGARWYFINTSVCTLFVPVFLGLPNLKKTDSAKLQVFNVDNEKFITHYEVFNKKLKVSYDVYFMILNVNHPLRL